MNRFARERHEYRALVFDGSGRLQGKGKWRIKFNDAKVDALALGHGAEHAVVQKVRLGQVKILETTVIK